MCCALPPPAALPPGSPSRTWIGRLAALLALVGLLVFAFYRRPAAVFAFQITALAVTSCYIPTAARSFSARGGWGLRVLVESLLFLMLMVAFKRWMIGRPTLGIWIVYATGLVLLVEIGGHIVEHYRLYHLSRVARDAAFRVLKPEAERLETTLRREVRLYLAVPSGLATGLVYCLLRGEVGKAGLSVCVQFVLTLASLELVYYAFVGLVRMWRPMLPPTAPTGRSARLKLAYMITDLRKVYLYDASHNVSLLGLSCSLLLIFRGTLVASHWSTLGVAFLLAIALLSELPYSVGQTRLHEEVLVPYEGEKRADVNKKLKENAPTTPKPEFVTALLTSSVAGSSLIFLAEHVVTEALKGGS